MDGAAEVLLADRRLYFFENGHPKLDSYGGPCAAMFDSMIVRYLPGHYPDGPKLKLWKAPTPEAQLGQFAHLLNVKRTRAGQA